MSLLLICSILSVKITQNCIYSFHNLLEISVRKLCWSKMDSFSKFKIYKNVSEILDDLIEHNNIQSVDQLLKAYNNAKIKYEEQKGNPAHPLIILEGLDGSGKTAMSRRLSKLLNAERWLTPPESIRPIREYFDSNSSLRTAFYSLGNYIAALEVLCILPNKPVVMDRFWHSTMAYALAQSVANNPSELTLPDPSDEIYRWPSDLLKPDKVILLNVSEEVRLERHSRRNAELVTAQERLLKDDKKFRENVIQAYKNMQEPEVTIVNGDGSIKRTLSLLMSEVEPLLKK